MSFDVGDVDGGNRYRDLAVKQLNAAADAIATVEDEVIRAGQAWNGVDGAVREIRLVIDQGANPSAADDTEVRLKSAERHLKSTADVLGDGCLVP